MRAAFENSAVYGRLPRLEWTTGHHASTPGLNRRGAIIGSSSMAGVTMIVTDPVCEKEIETENAAAVSEYDGVTYHFCSLECKEEFDSDPERFLFPPSEPQGS